MSHLDEEQVVDAYYNQLDHKLHAHLNECEQCRAKFERLSEMLHSVRDYPVPERGESYGREVWARLQPKLPNRKRGWLGLGWQAGFGWRAVAAVAALIVVAFVAGMLTEERQQLGFPEKARERVLLVALSNHLERSQILLTELVNATPGSGELTDERERARDLANENRLLRQTALHMGDDVYAGLLDDLQRVLLDVANSPPDLPASEVAGLRQRITDEGLLFKVRITSTDARRKEQKL